MEFFFFALIVGSFATWLTAEPDGVAAGVRGAATRAFGEGWSAGSQSASRRWQAGEADRTARRKKRHKRWRSTRKGRALIAADRARRATVGAAARGARLAIPATADAITAARRAAPQGWTERREERRTRQEEKESKEKQDRKAKKRRKAERAAQPETPNITQPGDEEIDPRLIEWDKAPDPVAHGAPHLPEPVPATQPDKTCVHLGCNQPIVDSSRDDGALFGVCSKHEPVSVACPHCGKTQLVRREHADGTRQAMADGCPQRPGGPGSAGTDPSTDTPAPAGTTQGDPVSENHLDLLKKLQGEAACLDGVRADMGQQVRAATEEASATTRDAVQLVDAVGGDVFGGNVQSAVAEVAEAAKQVEQDIQALNEAMDQVARSIEALREAIEAAQQAVQAAVGA